MLPTKSASVGKNTACPRQAGFPQSFQTQVISTELSEDFICGLIFCLITGKQCTQANIKRKLNFKECLKSGE